MKNKKRYVLYCRKSSEAEDKQVLSIESQVEELEELAKNNGLKIVEIITESKSAKAAGRPGFSKMIKLIESGRADSILCWKLDRLARNMIDGGTIIDMLQRSKIAHIKTSDGEHTPNDNTLYMSVIFGMANQFCIDLSNNVKRGMKKKLESGWRPGLAPPGYINDMSEEQGNRKIIKDPVGFKLIKRAFKYVLSGIYSPNQVIDILNDKWGYRTHKHKKSGGKPLAKSRFYRMLRDPFYYGEFEFPVGSGKWYKGKHPKMITKREFNTIQELLGHNVNPRPQENRLDTDLYGLFRCAECGSAITIDRKIQTICTHCKTKFSSKYKDACPKCNTKISKMKNPTNLDYTYYRCTKKKKHDCSQGAIERKELEKQVLEILNGLKISEKMKDWYIEELNVFNKQEKESRKDMQEALQVAYNDCQKRIDNLLDVKISPQNTNGSIMSDEAFARRNKKLVDERERIKEKMSDTDAQNDKWTKEAIKAFNFACYAKYWFEKSDINVKKTIISGLGLNLKIYDGKLLILLPKHLEIIEEFNKCSTTYIGTIEPKNIGQEYEKTGSLEPALSLMHGMRESNPRQRFWRPLYCHYTNPAYAQRS
jgi:site-specific DNA recombinase